MSTNKLKYKTETYRIFGIILSTPFGKFLLDPLSMLEHYGVNGTLIYATIYFVICWCGIIFVVEGYRNLE